MVRVASRIGRPIRRGFPLVAGCRFRIGLVTAKLMWSSIFGAGKPLAGRSPRFKVSRHDSKPSRGVIWWVTPVMLVAEVRSVKPMGGNHFTLVDAEMNDLVRPAMYGAHHRISLLDPSR